MKRFFVITNEERDSGLVLTKAICEYIRKRGRYCDYFVSKDSHSDGDRLRDLGVHAKGYDCALVLGGDGTLVRASRNLAGSGIPLIGVNLGTLGYLCELERGTVLEGIEQIMAGDYMLEERMMLTGRSIQSAEAFPALNDIVIHRTGKTQIIRLSVVVNDKFLYEYDADGIIVAAPTGSTGYNLSVGGPIVDPKAEMILITPISPHGMNARSIVIASDASISITLKNRRPEEDEMADVTYDGDLMGQIGVGEEIRICRADKGVQILKLEDTSFLQILSKKMKGYR